MSVCNDVIANSRYVISHDNIIVTTSQSVNECSVFLKLKDSTKITRCCMLHHAKNTPTCSFVPKSHCKQEVDVR